MGRALSIAGLLRKSTWTGEEVGKAFIKNLIYNFQEQIAGHGTDGNLFKHNELAQMSATLRDHDIVVFNRYVGLNNWVITNRAMADGFRLQTEACIQKLLGIITTISATESVHRYIERMPYIVTESQYERDSKASREKVFKTWQDIDLFKLMSRAMKYYLMELHDNPKAKNPMQAVKKKYEAEPVQSEFIKDFYLDSTNSGYYQLEDGTRSDQMSPGDWLIACLKPEYREKVANTFTGNHDEQEMGKLVVFNELLHKIFYKEEKTKEEMEELGYTEEEIQDAIDALGDEYLLPTEWHRAEDTPETFTKWEALQYSVDFEECYYCIEGGVSSDPAEYLEQAKDFATEFPELCSLLLQDISKKTGKDVTKIKPDKWQKTCWKVKSLYDMNIYDYQEHIDSGAVIYNGQWRPTFAGIAIIKSPGIIDYAQDNNGDYTEPTPANFFLGKMVGLEQYMKDNPMREENLEDLQECRSFILNGYKQALAFDVACELIADYTKLKDFTIFKVGADKLAERIRSINTIVPLLILNIDKLHYANPLEKEEKLSILKKEFAPLELEPLQIGKAELKKAKGMLTDGMSAFRKQDGVFMDVLLGDA